MDHGGPGSGPALERLGRAAARWNVSRWRAWVRHPSCRGRRGPSRLACPVAGALVLWAVMGIMPAAQAVPPGSPPVMRIRLVDHARARSGHPKHARAVRRATAAAVRPAAGPGAAVGALFYRGLGGQHFCTATVVHSPARDLIITAAHCVDPAGHPRHFVFVPGYQDGRAPYGVWYPRRVVAGAGWSSAGKPADDVAFAVMYPSRGKNIGDLVTGESVGRTSAFHGLFRVVGYPDGAQRPVACDNSITDGVHGLRFDCPGFTDGTSGSPWLAGLHPPGGDGWVAGVIGGYEEGGTSPSVSYSPVFGTGVINLYREAVRTGRQFTANG